MDILILNWKDIKHPEVGGAEIIVYELAKRLVAKGHRVTWYCRSFRGAKSDEMIDGIKVVRKGNLITTYLFAPFFYWTLPQKPDLVMDMSNTIYWQTPLWVWKSKKVAYLNQLAKEVFDYEYPPIISHIGKLIERLQYLTYRKTPFICYSKSTKDDLVSMGIPKDNINLFTLGLDHLRYVPGEKSKDPLFICVGRLVKMKRNDLAIKAMEKVSKKHPKAKLAIIGYGYDRNRLEKLREALKLKDSVYFQDENVLFFKKNLKDQKVKLMQQAWGLVFPSVKEGWGMTVTECAACGTPAIATNVTGLKDSVIEGKTGIILSQNLSVNELAEAMMRVIEDMKLRKKLSRNSIKWARNFNWQKSFEELEGVINSLGVD